VVSGTGEQAAILKGGEVVSTQKQFGDVMKAFANMANAKTGGGMQMNVKVENNASNKVSATPQMTADGLKILIKEVAKEGFADGSFDRSIAVQQSNQGGAAILWS
jgi:hypothetical protein